MLFKKNIGSKNIAETFLIFSLAENLSWSQVCAIIHFSLHWKKNKLDAHELTHLCTYGPCLLTKTATNDEALGILQQGATESP